MKRTKITSATIAATFIVVTLTGMTYCPYSDQDNGLCGMWSAWVPPGWCYSGECIRSVTCRTIEPYEGNGMYLYCTNGTVACTATLAVLGPPNCSTPQPNQTVPCSPPTTTAQVAVVLCPDR